jgi:hypothetical protein
MREARHLLTRNAKAGWHELLSRDRLQRRRALKRLSYVLPARPLFRFLYQYLLRGGFLDGRPGLHYCRLLSRYEAFTGVELERLRRTAT